MTKWSFPNNGNGQIRGIADAGIETFKGKELKSLAREMVQNSLDAVRDESQPVVVEFYDYTRKSVDIPGYETYVDVLDKSRNYWRTTGSKKAQDFLNSAYSKIKDVNTSVLRISDYNTTGLSKPFTNDYEGGWNALIKVDGGASKGGESSGSFGIGKNAAFANSNYRLVFYRTANIEGEFAAQGVARLLSYPEDTTKIMSSMTTGIGYYGEPECNMPVEVIKELNDISRREETGTDVFIYGFKYGITYDWKTDIIVEILENFLMSIYYGKLRVKLIGNIDINKDTLANYIEMYKNKAKNAYCNYLVLTASKENGLTVVEKDFHGMGTLKLSVLIDSKLKLNRKVLVVRKAGMRLLQLSNISTILSFSGILELQGKELNEFFRSIETPSHDRWEPERYEDDPKLAKNFVSEVKEWVTSTILDLGENSSDEELEVQGLSEDLQEDISEINENSDDKSENLNNHLGTIEIVEFKRPTLSRGKIHKSNHKGKETEDVTGTVDDKGDMSTTRTLKGQRKRTKRDPHKGRVDPEGKDILHKNKTGDDKLPPKNINNLKVIRTGRGEYTLNFTLNETMNNGHIIITTIGENNRKSTLRIKEANAIANVNSAYVENGNINFVYAQGEERVKIAFSLYDNRNYAMEVNIYEDD